MELQIPYCLCAEISAQRVLSRKTNSDRKDIASIMRMERDKDISSGGMPRSYPSIRGNPSEILSVEYYGISKGKEQYNAVRAIRRSKIQIPEP